MSQKLVITEDALLDRLRCPLRRDLDMPENALMVGAHRAAEWLIREAFEGRGTTHPQLLEVFDAAWKETTFYQQKASLNPVLYNRRVLLGARVCARLRDIICQSEIVQPWSSTHWLKAT